MIASPSTIANVPAEQIWQALAAPLPPESIAWRQDGKPGFRDGKHFARFVCYVEAGTVRERLDAVVPGNWDLALEVLPTVATFDGEDRDQGVSFKARLTILGVVREDVGTGKDYKSAATDAFKRAAVRFGIGHELYAMEQNWVQVDGDSKFAKPLEDPAAAYARRYGNGASTPAAAPARQAARVAPEAPEKGGQDGDVINDGTGDPRTTDEPSCPKCSGRMWNNIATKRNHRAPDFKCRDRSCDGVIWPEKEGKQKPSGTKKNERVGLSMDSPVLATGTDEIPF
jgi:hypothetical protein